MGGLQPARTVHNGGYCNGFGYRKRENKIGLHVVYFNQQMGALHAVHWLKSFDSA